MWYEFESFPITFVLENELKINWSWEKNFQIDTILIIALNLQMTVQASDNRLQPRLTNATVIINVVRGQPPFFLNTPYSTAVNERVAIGTSVYRVSAQDNDLIVSLLVIVVIKSYICDKRSWELAFYIYINFNLSSYRATFSTIWLEISPALAISVSTPPLEWCLLPSISVRTALSSIR